MGLLYLSSAGLLTKKLSIVLEKVFSEFAFFTRQHQILFTKLTLKGT
jgi:hypothetical protein